jgi:hypothetical protein
MNSAELQAAIEGIFLRSVRRLTRSPSPYSSSFSIEELQIIFENGESLQVLFKNLSQEAMLEGARAAKPEFLYAPEREIQVYRNLLSSAEFGTPKLYGAIVEPSQRRYGLFLEKVSGGELWEIGDFELWLESARWLARFHSFYSAERARAAAPEILELNVFYYRRWLERAHQAAGSALDRIAAGYDRVLEILLELSLSFIHGEFYASNILVTKSAERIRICPVDWEMAAAGPGLLDVAALASGKWNREERLRFLEAYHSNLPDHLQSPHVERAFDCCQLLIALQWIGWSHNWSPPLTHGHNWLDGAIQISRESSVANLFD